MKYRTLVATHLQSLADTGLTQQQVARRVGLKNGPYVSMLLNPDREDILALNRLPALAEVCELDDVEALRLALLLARDHPNHASRIDQATMHWLVKTSIRAHAARGPGKGSFDA